VWNYRPLRMPVCWSAVDGPAPAEGDKVELVGGQGKLIGETKDTCTRTPTQPERPEKPKDLKTWDQYSDYAEAWKAYALSQEARLASAEAERDMWRNKCNGDPKPKAAEQDCTCNGHTLNRKCPWHNAPSDLEE